MAFKISSAAKRAIMLGGMCSLSYLAVYVARNVLGAVTPQLIESGVFTTEFIGQLSSVYFITYAVGQLVNGVIGDRIKSKYMISFGLILSGLLSVLIPVFSKSVTTVYLIYGATGFFLSMIYAPMTKVVAENTEPVYATRCSLGFSFASLFGSPLAGVLAAVLVWQGVFLGSSATLVIMGCICLITFSIFEKRGIIEYGKINRQKGTGSIRVLIENRIIKFTLISVITGVVRTTVVFWLPTYISQYLGYSTEQSALIYTAATLVISFTTFVAVFLYERLRRNMDLTILIAFVSAAACFMTVYLFKHHVFNIVFMILAIMSSNTASTMLWSRYCPGLRDTGMVSSATGFLDFMSYMAASISSTLFANAVSDIGWGNLILVWFGLMLIGVLVAIPHRKRVKNPT
jgi:sugar phosphate permease